MARVLHWKSVLSKIDRIRKSEKLNIIFNFEDVPEENRHNSHWLQSTNHAYRIPIVGPERKTLFFLEMRVMRKIFTRAAANLFFLIN